MPKDGMRTPSRVTLADVAARAGVSRGAVSFVLNGRTDQRISAATSERVLAAARELGAQGFVVFHRDHLYDEHLAAIREAVKAGEQ